MGRDRQEQPRLSAADFWSTTAVANFEVQAVKRGGLQVPRATAAQGGRGCLASPEEEPTAETTPPGTLPFFASFYHAVLDSHVAVCEHLSQPPGASARGVALFLPGVFGGVGPGRAPGKDFDNTAIYPTVAHHLTRELNMPIDCYRLSWPERAPDMDFAVESVLSVHRAACQRALRGVCPSSDRSIRLFLVGHSYGGAVAIEAALRAAELQGHGAREPFRIAGLCTLNTILFQEQLSLLSERIHFLSRVRSLLVVGDADTHPEFTEQIHDVLQPQDTELRVLLEGTHDLFKQKEILINEVSHFIAKDFIHEESRQRQG